MGIKITVRTSKTLDVGDPETHEWVCNLGHKISPADIEEVGTYDFERGGIWIHVKDGCLCPMNMYKKD